MKEKFLYQPVSPFMITQHFGEDLACLSNTDNKTILTKMTDQTCPTGYRSLYALTGGHNGLDLMAVRWQPVYAAHSGIVNEVQTETERGLGVGIVSDEKRFFEESNSKEHYKTRYWHLIALDVHLGKKIKVGDFIGYADSTGYSSGDHLHFELKPVTINDYENGVPVCSNVLQKNGHLGAINPFPYMENIFAPRIANVVKQFGELVARVLDFISDLARVR